MKWRSHWPAWPASWPASRPRRNRRIARPLGNAVRILFQGASEADFKGGSTAEFESDNLVRGRAPAITTPTTSSSAWASGSGRRTTGRTWPVTTGRGLPDQGEIESTTLILDATWNILAGPFTPFIVGGLGWNWSTRTSPPNAGGGMLVGSVVGYVARPGRTRRASTDSPCSSRGLALRLQRDDRAARHYRVSWIDFKEAKGTPDFDGFQLSFGWNSDRPGARSSGGVTWPEPAAGVGDRR